MSSCTRSWGSMPSRGAGAGKDCGGVPLGEGGVRRGALPENVVLAPLVGEGEYAATLIQLKDVAMFEGDNEAERRGKRDDMRDLGAAPCLPRGGGRRRGP